MWLGIDQDKGIKQFQQYSGLNKCEMEDIWNQ